MALIEQSKIYPLGGKAAAKPMVFPDASGVPVNMLPISDGSVFNQLKQLLDSEGATSPMPIGSACWRPSASSRASRSLRTQHRAILDRAARTAYKISRVIGFEESRQRRLIRGSIPTAAGSIPSTTSRRKNPRATLNSHVMNRRGTIGTSTRGTGSSPTIIRSAPGWCRRSQARARLT